MKRRIIASIVVIVGALAVAAVGFRQLASMREESPRSETVAAPPLVRAERARRMDYVETLRGFGRAAPLRRATVAAEVDGVVRWISPVLEAGNAIERPAATPESGAPNGDPPPLPVLVKLDGRDLEDTLERVRAEHVAAGADVEQMRTALTSLRERLGVAEAELAIAKREAERIRKLVPKTLTPSDLDAQLIQVQLRQHQRLALESQIRENVEATRAGLARVDALARSVNLAERQQTRIDIRAPFAGRVETRQVDLGERVRVGDALFTLIDLTRVEVPIVLGARHYEEVGPDASVTLRLPESGDVPWQGTLDRRAPSINTQERTFFAYVVVRGTPTHNPLPPGAHVVAEVRGRTHPGVIPVPRRAFLGERLFVARPQPDGETWVVSERTPKVVRYLAGVALVSEGLEDGERFLVTNLESVAEGSVVRLAPVAGGGDAETPK